MRIFRFIAAKKTEHSIQIMCRVLEVSRSGYHAWAVRPPSARAVADEHPRDQIAIAVDQAFDRHADLLLGQATHFEQTRLELFELLLKMTHNAFDWLGHY